MNPKIFRQYDIRGIADTDLTDTEVELLGKAIGTYLKGAEIVVSMDNRLSSPRIKKALLKGLVSTGCRITDIGLAPSPVYYYAIIELEKQGGVMITASHNPSEFNGFKINKGPDSIYGDEILKLRDIMDSNQFIEGEGSVEETDILPSYIKQLKEKMTLNKKLKVVVDCGNGTGSVVNPQVLEQCGCDLVKLYCESDGTFPNHHPDPTLPKALKDLIAAVKKENADLGVGFDGDADRLGIIDEKGNILWGDQLMIIYARDYLKKNPGEKVLVEVKCSQALIEDIKAHGGIPIMSQTGHSLAKAKMKEENVKVAGEMSGHMFFSDEYYGFDDALYASLRLMRILIDSGKKLSQLLDGAPKYVNTPEIRAGCPDDVKFDIVKKLTEQFKEEYEVIDIDGARVLFEDGWGLVRASNTQPVLVMRYEAKTQEGLDKIKTIFINKLKQFPEVNLDETEN